MKLPIPSKSIKKVLVILPRNLQLIDQASEFVQELRNSYPEWRVELFDVDKLNKDELNRARLPKPEILTKLRKAGYHFVLDLNDHLDQLSSYIALMTEAGYRMHSQVDESMYYNIVYQPSANGRNEKGAKLGYEQLLNYLHHLFV